MANKNTPSSYYVFRTYKVGDFSFVKCLGVFHVASKRDMKALRAFAAKPQFYSFEPYYIGGC